MNEITINHSTRGEIIDIASVRVAGIRVIGQPSNLDRRPPDQIAFAVELDNGEVKYLAVSLANAYQIEQGIAKVRMMYPGLLENAE